MQESEFDAFADEYQQLHSANIRLSGEAPAYFADQKARMTARLLGASMPNAEILDFGTGVGNCIDPLRYHFPQSSITGIDVSHRSLELARTRFAALAKFEHFDGRRLPFKDGHFGLVFAACVFHHIDHAEHHGLLCEMRRVLAPGGSMVIFEHNPLNPLTVHAVNTCEFDRNARLISARTLQRAMTRAGLAEAKAHYSIFFPSFLRLLRPVESRLGWLPLGAQYCVVGRARE